MIENNPTDPPVLPVTPEAPVPVTQSFHRKKKNVLILLPLFILLFGVLGAVILTQNNKQDVRSHAALTGPSLSLSPATTTEVVGSTISLGMIMNAQSDTVSAAEFHLTYDPSALEIQEFTLGAPLPVVIVPEKHENGQITVTLGASPQQAFKGADIVGTWKVKILTAKQTTISFTDATQVASLGKANNTLTLATGSVITGSSPAGQSPTGSTPPTNTPAQIPSPAGRGTTPTTAPITGRPTRAVTPASSTSSFGTIVTTAPVPPTQNEQEMPPPTTPIEETPIPTTTAFQQLLSAILRFFQSLFGK